jgi:pectate lyase
MKKRKFTREHKGLHCVVPAVIFTLVIFVNYRPLLSQETAFPGALGWAAQTSGGRDGRIIRVTTLENTGPGSLREALAVDEPRIVVFEVGGVIDLDQNTLRISDPNVTVAGQTAPSPGITLIRGGMSITTNDVILQHIRVRPGEAGQAKQSGWEPDGISSSGGAYNVIIDHCSCTWGVDENLSASGPRFEGATPDEWRQNTSHAVTISNCIIAEGLYNSTHSKGPHSRGTLIHDNATEIAIVRNLFAHNNRRSPYFKGGARGIIVNNYIYNPGAVIMHYGLQATEWGDNPWETGQIAIVGNVAIHGPDTREGQAMFATNGTPCEVYLEDNIALEVGGNTTEMTSGEYTAVNAAPLWPEGMETLTAGSVREHVLQNAGARPWDRDAIDSRIVREATEGGGRIIDSEQDVGGYPVVEETRQAFDPEEWDLATMTRKTTGIPRFSTEEKYGGIKVNMKGREVIVTAAKKKIMTASVTIYDLSGRPVAGSGEHRGTGGVWKMTVPHQGVYFCKVVLDGRIYVEKLFF